MNFSIFFYEKFKSNFFQVTNRHRKHRSKTIKATFNRIMEIQCRVSKKNTTFLPKFSKTTLGIIIRGRKRERERRQVFKGKERQLRIGERGKRETEWSKTKSPRRAGPPAPPHNRLSIHGIENWVPGISFYVGSPVFVHSFPWATIFFFCLLCTVSP